MHTSFIFFCGITITKIWRMKLMKYQSRYETQNATDFIFNLWVHQLYADFEFTCIVFLSYTHVHSTLNLEHFAGVDL